MLSQLDQTQMGLQNLGWKSAIGQQIGSGFIDNYADQQVQKRVREIEARTRLQNLDQDIDLQNLGWAGAIGQQIGSSFLDNYADQQVQKRVKEIERMTRLQNLETAAESRERLMQCPEGQHW